MNEMLELIASDDTMVEASMVLESSLSCLSFPYAPPPKARSARSPWCSTLDDRDLRCLLQVIESDLIPQLLNSYSPARHAPIGHRVELDG